MSGMVMRVIFDLLHPAHLNFFKNSMSELDRAGIDINIIYRRRGQIRAVLEHDLPGKRSEEIGLHYKNPGGKFAALFQREYQIMKYLKKQNYDLTLGVAGFYIGFPAKMQGKSALTFTDDWEYKTTFYLSKYFSDYLVIPELIPATGKKLLKYKSYKELGYLHPNYYKPSETNIRKAGLKPGKYVFFRLVKAVSLNYLTLATGNLQELFKEIKELGYDIVLSPEEPEQAEQYKDICHILEAPVEDIHSWLANAALTITFGDTISRESCLLGTPTIYLGGRDMVVNNELIEMGCLKKIDASDEIIPAIKSSLEGGEKAEVKKNVKKMLESGKWLDTTQVIIDICNGILEDNQELINKYRK
jgi:predicted glycosyltransferase